MREQVELEVVHTTTKKRKSLLKCVPNGSPRQLKRVELRRAPQQDYAGSQFSEMTATNYGITGETRRDHSNTSTEALEVFGAAVVANVFYCRG
jgi:hypothetical protein